MHPNDDPTSNIGAVHTLALRIPDGHPALPLPAWAAVTATLAAWPGDESLTPAVERRFWRTARGGRLQQTVIAVLHDPLSMCRPAAAARELEELLRPLRAGRALAPLGDARLTAMRTLPLRYLAELPQLQSEIPEGGVAIVPLFAELLVGLQALPGPVGLSLLIAPVAQTEEDDEALEGADPRIPGGHYAPAALGPGRSGPPRRRVAFRLRLFGAEPLPATIRARAEALCLARRSLPGEWRVPLHAAALTEARRAVAYSLVEPSADDRGVEPDVAALTLALRGPRDAGRVQGRPLAGSLPGDGPVIGRVLRPTGRSSRWRLSWQTRRHHCFIAAASGAGKSTLILRVALDDIEQERTVILIDPHGDLADQLAEIVPAERLRLIDPRLADTHPLDLLDPQPERAAAHLLSAVSEVWASEFAGPVWNLAMTRTTRGLHASTVTDGRFSLRDIARFLTDIAWRGQVIAGIEDERLRAELEREHRAWQVISSNSDNPLVSWAASKLTPLTDGPGGQLFATAPEHTLEQELRAGSVLLVSLPLGTLGDATTRLAGRMFLTRLTAAIARQGDLPEHDRRQIAVFADEAHLLAGQALRGLFAQARKFNCAVTVACQAPSQLEPGLEEVLTNTQTHLLGRLSHRDAARLGDRIGEAGVRTLPTLPRHHLLLALEDNDPTLDPIVLTPVPVPVMPATGAIRSRFGEPAQEHAAPLDLPGEPAAYRSRSADPLRLPGFEELLDELFPLTRHQRR